MRAITSLFMFAVLLANAAPAAAQDKAAAGQKLYAEQKCAMCHSVAGVGNKKFPLDGVGKHPADDLKLWLVDPKAAADKAGKKMALPMKSYKALSAADIDALVAYMQTLK